MSTSKRFIAKNGVDNNNNTIQNVSDPVNAQDASTKNFSINASNLSTGTVSSTVLPLATTDDTKAGISSTLLVTPSTLNSVVPYTPIVNPTLDLDFTKQSYRHYSAPDGFVSHPMTPFITFTRSSTATYFDAMGVMQQASANTPRIDYDPLTGECRGLLVEEQRTNYVRRSSTFEDNLWSKIGGTGSPSAPTVKPRASLAPDGTLTACTIGFPGQTVADRVVQNTDLVPVATTAYTASVWLKGTGTIALNISTTTGVGGQAETTCSLTQSWQKFTISVTTTSSPTGYMRWMLVFRSGNTATEVLVWGAQLEAGSFPTSYIPTPATFTGRASTATYLDANGVVQTAASGVARSAAYDYDSDEVLRPIGLLLEASATNQLLYSEQFDNAAWSKGYLGVASVPIVTANYGAAPDGQTTADRVVFALNGGTTIDDKSELQQMLTTVAGTTYTQSVWLKTTDGSTKVLQLSFNGENPKLITVTGTWQRFSNTGVAGDTYRGFRLALRGTTGTSNSADVLIWGAQQGVGSYPTSYIPTTTAEVTRAADTSTSAQATRAADSAVISGTNFSQWYKQYEGTVFAESINTSTYTVDSAGYSRGLACFSDGSDTNRIRVGIDAGVSSSIRKAGTDQAYQTVGTISIGTKKTSISYKTDSVVSSVDGVLSSVDASAAMPYLTQLEIGKGAYIGGKLSGHLRKLRYYPKALTATELQAMTSQ